MDEDILILYSTPDYEEADAMARKYEKITGVTTYIQKEPIWQVIAWKKEVIDMKRNIKC